MQTHLAMHDLALDDGTGEVASAAAATAGAAVATVLAVWGDQGPTWARGFHVAGVGVVQVDNGGGTGANNGVRRDGFHGSTGVCV